MLTQTAYCSACDQDVHVVITDPPVMADQAPIEGGEVVCLDFGARCTGAMCPMFGLPKILMAVRLARSGLRPEAFESVTLPCEECGVTSEMKVLDDSHALCTTCGSRVRWVRITVGESDYIALATAGSGD
jgi:hypothetical protein